MTQQPATENPNGFFRNDSKLVCSMLVVYGLCILGLIAFTFWGLNRRRLTLSANATSTAFAVVTQQANGTATAIAHTAEQAQYKFIDTFDDKSGYWSTESVNDELMKGSIAINTGLYV